MASLPIRALLLCPVAHSMAQLDELLMEAGVTQLDIARDPHEALAQIQALATEDAPPHALIIGVCDTPPVCQALHIYQHLQQHQAISEFSALLLISADASNELVNASMELQVDEFIVAPYQRPALLTRLHRLVSRFQASVELGLKMHSHSDALDWQQNLAVLDAAILQQTNLACYTHWLKLKGISLTRTGQWQKAAEFYAQVLNQHVCGWAVRGSVACSLALEEYTQAEKQLLSLSLHPAFALLAYNMMGQLYLRQQDYDAALETTHLLCDISPFVLTRHYQAVLLARLCGDYTVAVQAAERFVVFAEQTGQLNAETLLLATRACMDEEHMADKAAETPPYGRVQAWLQRVVETFPSWQVAPAYRITQARLALISGHTVSAANLQTWLKNPALTTEDQLELAKALHTAGDPAQAIGVLTHALAQCPSGLLHNCLAQHLAQMQMTTKSHLQLRQEAQQAMQQTHYAHAMVLLQQARQITPKCVTTALQLLQATVAQLHHHRNRSNLGHQQVRALIRQCQQTVESTELDSQQQTDYQDIQLAINQLFS